MTKRVAHILNSLGTGGVPEAVLGLVQHGDAAGYAPCIYCLKPAMEPDAARDLRRRFEAAGAEVHVALGADKIDAVAHLADWLVAERIDLLHSHSFRPNLQGRMAGFLCRPNGLRIISHYHNQYDDKWLPGSTALALERRMAAGTDAMIAVSGAVQKHVAARLGVPRDGIVVIPNGIAAEKTQPRTQVAARGALGLLPEEEVIGCVGRICRQKGQDLFAAAALDLLAQGHKGRFVLIGAAEDSDLTASLKARIAAAGAEERIILLGHIKDMANVYAALDLLVAPSRWEGFGLMLVEAMAAGCPVVAARAGAIPEVAGGAARLVGVEEVRELASAIAGTGPEERRRMAAAGRLRAADFGWPRAAAQVEALYDRVLRC